MDNTIDSSVPNTFCNEGSSTTDPEFVMPAIGGNVNPAWSFYSVMHVFQGDCP